AQGIGAAGKIHLHGMVDNQVNRDQGFDDFWIFAEAGDGAAHRREVNEQGHAGEILQDNAGDDERDFGGASFVRFPIGKLPDIGLTYFAAITIAQDGFQNETDGDRQLGDGTDTGFFQRG